MNMNTTETRGKAIWKQTAEGKAWTQLNADLASLGYSDFHHSCWFNPTDGQIMIEYNAYSGRYIWRNSLDGKHRTFKKGPSLIKFLREAR